MLRSDHLGIEGRTRGRVGRQTQRWEHPRWRCGRSGALGGRGWNSDGCPTGGLDGLRREAVLRRYDGRCNDGVPGKQRRRVSHGRNGECGTGKWCCRKQRRRRVPVVVSTCFRGLSTRPLALCLLLFLPLLPKPHLLLLLHRPKLIVGVFRTMFGVGTPAHFFKHCAYLWSSFLPHFRNFSRDDCLGKPRLSREWRLKVCEHRRTKEDPCIAWTLYVALVARDGPYIWHGSRRGWYEVWRGK